MISFRDDIEIPSGGQLFRDAVQNVLVGSIFKRVEFQGKNGNAGLCESHSIQGMLQLMKGDVVAQRMRRTFNRGGMEIVKRLMPMMVLSYLTHMQMWLTSYVLEVLVSMSTIIKNIWMRL